SPASHTQEGETQDSPASRITSELAVELQRLRTGGDGGSLLPLPTPALDLEALGQEFVETLLAIVDRYRHFSQFGKALTRTPNGGAKSSRTAGPVAVPVTLYRQKGRSLNHAGFRLIAFLAQDVGEQRRMGRRQRGYVDPADSDGHHFPIDGGFRIPICGERAVDGGVPV